MPTLVAGAGGFIGGHLVGWLNANGFERIRAVDAKPLENWYQRHPDVENAQLDLSTLEDCRAAARDMGYVFNLAADMGGMGFISTERARCMLTVLTTSHLLMAANDMGADGTSTPRRMRLSGLQTDVSDVQALREEDAYPAMPEDGLWLGELVRRAASPHSPRGGTSDEYAGCALSQRLRVHGEPTTAAAKRHRRRLPARWRRR